MRGVQIAREMGLNVAVCAALISVTPATVTGNGHRLSTGSFLQFLDRLPQRIVNDAGGF